MQTNQSYVQQAKQTLLNNYLQAPLVISKGRGCTVEDVEGHSYLDLCAGLAVVSVGHSHPTIVKAITEQASQLTHVSNLFYNQRAIELAFELQKRTGFEYYFFCNSGAEANEALIKLSRRYHYECGNSSRTRIISAHGSFHGRTIGALTLTGEPKYHKGMGPLMGGVSYVRYNDIADLERTIDDQTAAVILEPIQGEGGVVTASDSYLQSVRRLCDEADILLLFDEVQTGYGRTGRFLAREYSGVMPDACSIAKGIAAGFPLGAIAVTPKLKPGLPPGSHATTFGGNALACAVGLAVLSIFDKENLVENAFQVGEHLGKKIDLLVDNPKIPAAIGSRGKGLLRGIELSKSVDSNSILNEIRKKGVLLSLAGGNVLRFSPPLCISIEEINKGFEIVESVLEVQV